MNKKEEQKKENKKESLTKKLKDKKYKAKLELIIGFSLIIVLLIYANITGVGNNYDYNNTTNTLNNINEETETFNMNSLTNNYTYNIEVYLTKQEQKEEITDKDNNENTTNEQPPVLTEYTYNYNGKRYKENTIINKLSNNVTTTYYKVEDKYYIKNNETYTLFEESNIYDLIEEKYLSLENIKEYITTASLDHTTNYSNGNISYVYDLKVKDIIKNYTDDKSVKIEINIENNLPIIVIDYSNLLNTIDNTINECKVTIKYTDINKIEEFTIIEEQTENND